MTDADPAAELRERLERLRLLTLDRLIEILEQGVPVQKPDAKSGEVREIGRAPAPPAYLSAAIRLLKDNGVAGTGEGAEDLDALLASLPDFDDEEEDEEG